MDETRYRPVATPTVIGEDSLKEEVFGQDFMQKVAGMNRAQRRSLAKRLASSRKESKKAARAQFANRRAAEQAFRTLGKD